MQITLTDAQLADILNLHMPVGYVLKFAETGWCWYHQDRRALGSVQRFAIGAFIDAWRDFDGRGAREIVAKIRVLVA